MELMALRVAIKEGRIKHTDILFKYKGQKIYPDKDGRLSDWPEGMADTLDKMLMYLAVWGGTVVDAHR